MTAATDAAARYRATTRVAERLLPDRVMLQLVDRPAWLELTGTALCLWLALDEEPTLEVLVRDLTALFAADPDVVRADVTRMLAELVEGGFVERR